MPHATSGYTVAEIIEEMELMFGKQDEGDADFQTTVLNIINDVEQSLWRKHDWSFTHTSASISATSTTAVYALAADCTATGVELMWIPSAGMRVRPISHRMPTIVDLNADDTGTPTRYAYWGMRSVILYPKPDAAYTISYRYKKKRARLTATTDYLQTPEDYQDLVKTGVIAKICRLLDDDRYVTAAQEFEAQVSEAWREDSRYLESDLHIQLDNEELDGAAVDLLTINWVKS